MSSAENGGEKNGLWDPTNLESSGSTRKEMELRGSDSGSELTHAFFFFLTLETYKDKCDSKSQSINLESYCFFPFFHYSKV